MEGQIDVPGGVFFLDCCGSYDHRGCRDGHGSRGWWTSVVLRCIEVPAAENGYSAMKAYGREKPVWSLRMCAERKMNLLCGGDFSGSAWTEENVLKRLILVHGFDSGQKTRTFNFDHGYSFRKNRVLTNHKRGEKTQEARKKAQDFKGVALRFFTVFEHFR